MPRRAGKLIPVLANITEFGAGITPLFTTSRKASGDQVVNGLARENPCPRRCLLPLSPSACAVIALIGIFSNAAHGADFADLVPVHDRHLHVH